MPDDENVLEATLTATVSKEADNAFKSFDDKMKRLAGVADKLDKSLARVYAASERVAKTINRATTVLERMERSTAAANKTGQEQVGVTNRVSTAVENATNVTRRNTKEKEKNSSATERQRKEEERLSKYLEKRRPQTLQARMSGIADKASSFGNRAGVGAGVAAAGIGYAWKSGMDFDKQLTYLGITAESTDGQMKKVRGNIMALSDITQTNQSVTKLAEGLGLIVASGTSLTDADKMLYNVGRAATASGAEVGDMAAAGIASTRNLKIAVEDLGYAFDIMNKAGKMGNFEIKDMAKELPSIASAAAAIGIQGTKGLSQITAALEVSRMGAGDNQEAANNLFNLYNKITSKEASGLFQKEFGVNLEQVVKGAQNRGDDVLGAVLDVMERKTKGDPFKIAKVFQDQQVLKAIRALMQNRAEYEKIKKGVEDSKGTTDKDYAKVQASQFARYEQFQNAIQSLTISLGSLFGPAMSKVASVVSSVSQFVVGFTDKFPVLSSVLGTGTVALVGMVAAAAGVAKVISIVASTIGGVSRAMLLLTARGRRFIAVTDYRGGSSGRGTYMTGFGRGGIGRRGSRLGRGMRGLGMGGSVLAGLAEMMGFEGAGDALDAVDMARDAREAETIRRQRRTRGVRGFGSRAWGAVKGVGGKALAVGRAGLGLARAGLGAAAAGLGGTVAGASAATVGGVVVAGAGLGYAIAQGIQKGTEWVTGKDVSTHFAEWWTKGMRASLDQANAHSKDLFSNGPGNFLHKGAGERANEDRRAALDVWTKELARVNADIASKGATPERALEKKLAESSIAALNRQLAGNFDPAAKSAMARGQANAAKAQAPIIQDHSSITIKIEGGPKMTTEEMAQATAQALAEAARKQRRDDLALVRGAYSDGVATKG